MIEWFRQLKRWHSYPIHEKLKENQIKRLVLIDFKLEPQPKEY